MSGSQPSQRVPESEGGIAVVLVEEVRQVTVPIRSRSWAEWRLAGAMMRCHGARLSLNDALC